MWQVSRNGRRAVLTVVPGLKLDGDAVATGTQVSKKLSVAADLLAAPEAALPEWARIGDGVRLPGTHVSRDRSRSFPIGHRG